MADQGIALVASNMYSNIQDRPKMEADPTTYKGANDFQNVVKVQFNKFANMSPDQILSHIRVARASSSVANNHQNSAVASSFKSVRTALNKHEQTARKALVNEASLIDVLTATTEATNTVKTMVEVRNKILDAYEKVFAMNF